MIDNSLNKSQNIDLLNKLMIVAHPDDELLFGGYYLIKYQGWDVICLTNKDNWVRYNEFKTVMEKLNINYYILGYKDEKKNFFLYEGLDITQSEVKLKNDLFDIIKKKNYDIFVTHNPFGEYGHPQHIYLSNLVYSIIKNKERIYYFDINNFGSTLINENDNYQKIYNPYKKKKIILDDNIITYKKKLLEIYSSQKEIFQRPKIKLFIENSIITNSVTLE